MDENINQGLVEQKELLKVTMPDEELIRLINRDINSAMPLYEKMKKIQDENEKYYLGEQLNKNLFDYEIPSAENLLYMATETIISIVNSNRKEPIVMASQNNDESRDLASKTQQFLTWKWGYEGMNTKYGQWIRHAMLYRIGVLKVRFDEDLDDFEINLIRPQRIMIDQDATNEYDAKFIIEFKKDTLDNLEGMFPKAKDKLKEQFGEQKGSVIEYLEYWTNEFVVWKAQDVILDKKKNPNWNWDEKDRKGNLDKLREKWTTKTKEEKLENILLNYFNEPQKPYVILALKVLGKSIYADTSDFEQAKVVQDTINKRKRLIDKAATKALGREVYSGSFISKEEAKKSISNPNAPMWLESGKASDAVTYIAPSPLAPTVFDDMMESKQALDNIMGTHGTTRGERGPQETATGRTILRQGDYGRIDLSVKIADEKLELLYGWMMQMAKVFYTEKHFMRILGREATAQYLEFSSDDIQDGQEVLVKSEITSDKSTQRENLMRSLQAGLIDPLSYFEGFDDPNPKEKARRLVFYMTDPKLYLAQFCSDPNAEGAENDPMMRAEQENSRMEQGEIVPPYDGATADHVQKHAKRIKKSDFKMLPDDIQVNFMQHVQAEIEILRNLTQMKPMVSPEQAMKPPQGLMGGVQPTQSAQNMQSNPINQQNAI